MFKLLFITSIFLILRSVTQKKKKQSKATDNKDSQQKNDTSDPENLFRAVPEKGKFDLKKVLESVYFFSWSPCMFRYILWVDRIPFKIDDDHNEMKLDTFSTNWWRRLRANALVSTVDSR